jgi:hypothetical protein
MQQSTGLPVFGLETSWVFGKSALLAGIHWGSVAIFDNRDYQHRRVEECTQFTGDDFKARNAEVNLQGALHRPLSSGLRALSPTLPPGMALL